MRKVEEQSASYRNEPGYRNQWGLEAIHADRAYAHLRFLQGADAQPGAGVTIGFVDSGIDQNHPAFSDTAFTERFMRQATDETGDEQSHGTLVASVAAGGRVSSPKAHHGVAWGADIAMFAIPLGSGGGPYAPLTLAALSGLDSRDAALFQSVLGEEIDILNLSIGFDGNIEDYSESQLRANYAGTIAAFAQANTREKKIIVRSASNEHGSSCDVNKFDANQCANGRVNASSPHFAAALPARIEELRGHYIAVVAVQKDGSIAWFSNRCGIAADYCVAAPGVDVRSAHFGPAGGVNGVRGWKDVSGTSLSAPMVSGGLAVMKQLFRGQLSNTELLSRLLATADKTGIYADRAIYGQGLLDLGAATNPWGIAAFMGTGQTVAHRAQAGLSVAGSVVRPGRALGDSFAHALGQREVAAFDELGAPFWFAAGNFVQPLPRSSAAIRLSRLFADSASVRVPDSVWRLNVRSLGQAGESGHLALADRAARFDLSTPYDWSASLFHRPQEGGSRPLSGFATEWRSAGLPMIALQAGGLVERDSLLGSYASGGFGRLAGRTAFVAARLEMGDPQGWLLTARGELGAASPDLVRGPLIRDISTLRTRAFRVSAVRSLRGATVRFSVEQPTLVTSGIAVLDLPTGRTRGGQVAGEAFGIGLAPTGQQLDVSARVDYPLAGGTFALESVWSRQPGHQADTPPQWMILAGWRKRF